VDAYLSEIVKELLNLLSQQWRDRWGRSRLV
jgi:hypothetical protein